MKEILHIGLSNHLGGIETYILKISSYIDKEKYHFNFLIYDNVEPCFYNELKSMGCTFYSITSRRKNYLKNIKELEALFRSNKFDVVHCHLNSLSYIQPCIQAVKSGCKAIVHSHNAGCLQGIKSRVFHKINYLRLPKNKIECVAVSDLAGNWMFGDNVKFTVLNNGLDVNNYIYSAENRYEIRNEFNIADDQEVILHVGAFRPQKNHKFLIEIFNDYLSVNPFAVLLLVGEGPLKSEIEEMVRKLKIDSNVKFIGLRDDISKLLSASDKFLFPSFYEGFPCALIEAETSGLKCVVADTITRQAIIEPMCCSVSLNSDIKEWTRVLSDKNKLNRIECAGLIDNLGFGITAEMDRIMQIYNR